MKNKYKLFIEYYISLSRRRPLLLLFIYMILSLTGLFVAASNIRIETDLAALLPEDTDSVRALEISENRIGAIDYFTIAIESKTGNVATIAKLQDQLKARIEKEWKDATWVQTERNTDFFRKHALYYLEKKKLLQLRYLLEDELVYASAKSMPGMINFLDDEEADENEPTLDTWYSEDIPKQLGLPSQVCRSFNDFFNADDEQEDVDDSIKTSNEYADRLISSEGDVGVVLVKLSQPSTDIEYAKMAIKRSNDLVASIVSTNSESDLQVEVVGAYRKFMEVEVIAKDGQTATIISVILVLFLLFVFFRSFRTIAVVFIPLIAAASLTMGIVGLTYGRLTVLTVFILALLVGMGIDYGIHLFGRIKQEIRFGQDLSQAMITSLSETGLALLAAAATTVASMLVLLFGHFEGFREFGVVASFGLIACAASAMLIIPPLVFFIQRFKGIETNAQDELAMYTPDNRLFGISQRKLALTCFAATLFVVISLSVYAPDTQFEYDIRNIMSPATESPIDFMRAIGKDSGTAPAIILGEDLEQLKKVHAFLLDKLIVQKDESLMSFVTYHTFVPSMEDQIKRQKIIKQIGRIIKKKALQNLEGDKGKLVRELSNMTDSKPFDHTHLPDWAKRIVTEANGEIGQIGHIYGDFDEYNVYSGQDFQDRYGHLTFDGKWVPIACSRFILSDVVRMVKSDGLRLLVIVSLVLIAILFFFTRRIKATFILFGVIAVGGMWTAGIIGFWDIRISLYNIIVIPVILGVGIDGAIHMYHKYHSRGIAGISHTIRTTGVTVSASSITTMAGFIGLVFVDHKGLQTIGQLGTIGIATSWLAVMLVLPFMLPFTYKKAVELDPESVDS